MKQYYKHTMATNLNINNIMTIEYLELSTKYVHITEKHSFWELVYVDRGVISYFIQDSPIVLKEGQVLFLSPNQSHSIKANGAISPNIFVICFECKSPLMNMFTNYISSISSAEKFYLKQIISETQQTFKMPFKDKLEPLENASLCGEQAIKLYLELFLIMLLRHGLSKKNMSATLLSAENFYLEIANVVIKELEKNVYTNISIDDICANVNYSKSYVSKIFKQITSETIITYFNRLKIEEAKKLIRETSYTMAQISDSLNFSDPRYFIHVFKKVTNFSPKQYKNSIRSFN